MRAEKFCPKVAACTIFLASFATFSTASLNHRHSDIRRDSHSSPEARASNNNDTLIYKDPNRPIEDRVSDLLARMTIEDKVGQLMQLDISDYMDMTDPTNNSLTHNQTGLEEMAKKNPGFLWAGYEAPWDKIVYAIKTGQTYMTEHTNLGIPIIYQTEGLHGFPDNGTTWPSPIGVAATFNNALWEKAASTIATEAEGLGYGQVFAPDLDLSRELRWGRVEECYSEDPFLTGQMGRAYVRGIQSGRRRNTSETAIARMAATCKHFAAYGSPQGGLNTAPVSGGERELRSLYLKPFKYACMEALGIMSSYASYDGRPSVANKFLLTDILRDEWKYNYTVISDAGAVDMLINPHGVCATRQCAAKAALESGLQIEMGGGSSTYLTLAEQINSKAIDVKYLDEAVRTVLRIKFELGLFESNLPYDDYESTMRTQATRDLLDQVEREAIVLLENKNNILPLSKKNIKSIALIGPMLHSITIGDYVFETAVNNSITPLQGFTQFLANSSVNTSHAEGCKPWSNDESGFDEARAIAKKSDVAIVGVGTWTLDQQHLWIPGTNATTGEHVDLSDLGLVGAQAPLVKAIIDTGTPTIVVFVSGKPVSHPWIKDSADAVIQQFYPGERGALALAAMVFGDYNPSGRLPLSFPRSVGTAPAFYNYLKGGRPIDAGSIYPNGTLQFGHQYVLDNPTPIWGFGHGLSYTTFSYTDLRLSSSTIDTDEGFNVTVTVKNSGSMDGQEVVQIYMTHLVSSVVTPNKELIGFTKVFIAAGQSQTVSIPVTSDQLAVWTTGKKWVVEKGDISIFAGTSEQVYLNTTLTVQ